MYTILGQEFGELAGKKALIKRALYGLKAAGADFTHHLADCMFHMKWKRCWADLDLWYREAITPDKYKYYCYVLIYVDDLMVIHHEPKVILLEVSRYFVLKPHPTYNPNYYLGSKLRCATLPNGVAAWGMSSSKYIQAVVLNAEKEVKQMGQTLPKRANTPFPSGYRPELDASELLS